MTDTMWSSPARELIGSCEPTMRGLWTALFTTQNAALTLAVSASVMPVGDFTEVAMDLADAVDALEECRPSLISGTSVQLPLVSPIIDYAGPAAELAEMVANCIALAAAMLGNKAEELSVPEILATSRAVQCMSDAHVRITGRLP